MTARTIRAYESTGGIAAARDHVFVLPSVICTTLVAKKVASATGAVTIRHQDGCGHIGNDVGHGLQIYSSLARNPNVCATLVLSLGCETLQGGAVAADLEKHHVPVELLRLQAEGAAALEHDAAAAVQRIRHQHQRERQAMSFTQLRVGILADRDDDALSEILGLCSEYGVDVVLAGKASLSVPSGTTSLSVPSGTKRVDPAPDGLQRLTTLAAAGVSVIVAFPDRDEAPFSISMVPVVTVASSSVLHEALVGDFDVSRPEGAELWRLVVDTVEGRPTAAEYSGMHNFALPRLRRTM